MEGEFLAKSDMPRLVWRNWAPPKCKFFAWLVLQNRIWTADRLVKRGWPNQGTCPYVMPQLKMLFTWLFIANTLFRFGISSLHGFPTLTIAQPMAALLQVKDWWTKMVSQQGFLLKGFLSLSVTRDFLKNNTCQSPHCKPKSRRRLAPGAL